MPRLDAVNVAPRDPRHVVVEQQEVEGTGRAEELQGLLSVLRDDDLVPLFLQGLADHHAEFLRVVREQDAGH